MKQHITAFVDYVYWCGLEKRTLHFCNTWWLPWYLIFVYTICNSMAASLCLKSREDHSLLKSYNGGKQLHCLGPVRVYRCAGLINEMFLHVGCPLSSGKTWRPSGVSQTCLLIEIYPICKSMAAL